MTDWLIKEEVYALVPAEIKERLREATWAADTLGELFLGVVVITDGSTGDEYVILNRTDFEAWYGE